MHCALRKCLHGVIDLVDPVPAKRTRKQFEDLQSGLLHSCAALRRSTLVHLYRFRSKGGDRREEILESAARTENPAAVDLVQLLLLHIKICDLHG